jgi:hypothetical protein
MLRRFLFLSVGAIALLAPLGEPSQLHAQHMRGGFPNRVMPSSRNGFMPGFRTGMMPGFRGGSVPGFRNGIMPGFRRFDRFEDRFEMRLNRFNRFNRFDRFEDRFDMRFNRGLFDPRFHPVFGPGFFRPF